MPADYGVWLYDEKGGTPIRPSPGEDGPEDPIMLSQPRVFGLVLQGRNLLSQSEVLCGKLRAVAKYPKDEHYQDANRAHFTAS